MDEIAGRVRLNLLVEAEETARRLDGLLENRVGVFVKIDTGYGRTGIPAEETELVAGVLSSVSESRHLEPVGLLTHAGHSYAAGNPDGIHAIHHMSLDAMVGLKEALGGEWERLVISVGDTPTCSLAGSFEGVDEIRPGNFVFYDAMQCGLGTCACEDVAVALACPVVAVHPERKEILVHGGAVHLSKDYLGDAAGERSFGLVVELDDEGWGDPVPGARVSKLSQEHGTIVAPEDLCARVRIGDLLGVLPVHSCLTANLMGAYLALEGEGIDHLSGVGRL
jgi:D-serine deaminase-like pyridoxal phosphate-dependent protein